MLRIFLFGFLIIGSAKLDSIPFQDCGSADSLLEVDIDGCHELPCVLTMGRESKIAMKLISKLESKNLNQDVELILRGVHTPIAVTPSDPCHEINCPVGLNHNAVLNAIMSIPNSEIVPVDGLLSWRIHNDAGKRVVCMETEITIETNGYNTERELQ